MELMWNYSEAFTSHRHKTIILYFLTTTCRSYFLVKLRVWINHVDTWRRFDDDTKSMRLHIYFVSTLKQLCVSKGMQLYKAINSAKKIFLGFWAMVQSSYTVMQKSFEKHLLGILRWPITATAITKRNAVKKEILINEEVLL